MVAGKYDIASNRLVGESDTSSGGLYLVEHSAEKGFSVLGSLPVPASRVAVAGNTVYASGVFNAIGGKPRNNIAAVDAQTKAEDIWYRTIPPAQRLSRQEMISIADMKLMRSPSLSAAGRR